VLGDPGNWREVIAAALGKTPPANPTPTPGHPVAPPGYESLLYGIPGFAAGIGSVTANEATAARQRADAIKAALVQFGVVPAGWTSGYGDVDQATIDAANQNPFSTIKGLLDTQHRSQADLEARLADRGTLSSGALTGGTDMGQRNYDKSVYGETNALLKALGGYETGYATRLNDLELQRAGLIGDAAQKAATNPDILTGFPAVPKSPQTYADLGIKPQPITSDLVKPPVVNRTVVRPPGVAPPARRRRSYGSVPSSIGSYIR